MIEPSITVDGLYGSAERLFVASGRVRQAVNRRVVTLTEEIAEKVRERVAQFSRSGRLLESIKTRIDYFAPTVVTGEVYADETVARYAGIQEFGGRTPRHLIQARNGRMLRFRGGEGDIVFRQGVWQSAKIPAKRYMAETFDQNRDYIIAELRAAAREAL